MNPLILYDVFQTFYHFYSDMESRVLFFYFKNGRVESCHASIYSLYIQIDRLTYRFTPDIFFDFLYIVMVSTDMAMFYSV